VNMYPFIEAERASDGNVERTCAVLEVSRSAYYQWSKQEPSKRQREDEELEQQIKKVHEQSRQSYGSPRVHQALRRQGRCVGRKRVARLMQKQGLAGRLCRRLIRTTIPQLDASMQMEDLVGRQFDPKKINAIWAGDITYVRTWEGWLYLATVIDLGSRRVVGFAMAEHMRAELVCKALKMALQSRRVEPGLIFHSDRGSQYTSTEFAELLAEHQIRQSFSRPRQCWDNAVAESFFATLKTELIDLRSWLTRASARRAIFEYIEVFYNRQRLHSRLGYRTPAEHEASELITSLAA
jgi:transposase InsO family protein